MNIEKPKDKYEFVCFLCKLLSPVAIALFYISVVSILLLIIIAAIIFFVNVPVEKMMLPPFMQSVVGDNNIPSFSIDLGIGVKIVAPQSEVVLNDIKAVIYSLILLAIASLGMFAPIFKFLSKLFKNVGDKNLFSEENAKMINFVGLTVLLGNTIVRLVSQLYIFTLTNTFLTASTEKIGMAFSIEWGGMVIGGFIILLGSIYGCAAEVYRKKVVEHNKAVVPEEI